jgi:cytidylate kinase
MGKSEPTPPSADPSPGHVPDVAELVRVVALDGPAGSGKSTVARLVADRLGWRFVDTGATYRAVTLAVLRSGADPEDPEACAEAARGASLTLSTRPGDASVWLDGDDVTRAIRAPDVTAAVSAVSSHPEVREVLIALQRAAMGTSGSVVEGRDIATVVAPYAAVKVYLDARPEVRAARRGRELGATGSDLEAALLARDHRDNQTNRLAPSGGAVLLDTSDLTLDQVVDAVVELAAQAGLT